MLTRGRDAVRAVLASLALLCVLACAAPASARDRIVVALQLEPPTLDPTAGAASAIDEVTYRTIYEGLTRLDATGAPMPLLATGWTMAPDARSYVFRLRGGVRFADGTPFDARVVAFSLLRAGAPGSANAQAEALGNIAGVDMLDPLTVRIRLKQPDAGLPALLAWGDSVMVSPRAVAALATTPVGTGPFLYASWVRGDRLTLSRNEGYWGVKPSLKAIQFRFVGDPAAAYAGVKTHEIDLFPDYPAPENLAQLRADPSLAVSVNPSQAEVIVALNNARGPFRDLRVRRAIAHAIDRRAIIDGAMSGYGTPIGSHFPPQSPDYVDLTGRYPHDLGRARALLADAGYPNGFTTVLALPPAPYAHRTGEIVAAQLHAIGITVRIVPLEWAQWLDQVFARHDYAITIVAHAEPADYAIYGRSDYYFGYDGRGVKALLDRLRATSEPAERHGLLGAVQRRIADDAVNAFLFQYPHMAVADRRLTGVWINTPLQSVDFSTVRFAGDDGAGLVRADRAGRWLIGASALFAALIVVQIVRAGGAAWLMRRVTILALTLAGASLFVFALLQLAPGDPAQYMMGLEASPAALTGLRVQLGLEGSAVQRYVTWASGLLHGDFGISYTYRIPVAALIGPRIGLSLALAALAILVSVALALPAAILAARRPGGWGDRLIGAAARLGLALPSFWLAMLLLLLFAVRLRWLPASGFSGWDAGVSSILASLLLPASALALPQAAVIVRVARNALGAELTRDYVRTARAKGLRRDTVLWRHVLPNAAAPIVAVIGLQFPFLLGGSVIVENIFYLPGLGRLLLQAITGRDLIVVQGVAMVLVVATVLASLLTDVAQALLDPRAEGRQ
ncbi:ABC transporter substrate-binding protein [uncultured Sphingomonas sp.]|uniref:ABC transporter substrate-binding protein n=1 Tax=uncultured Sphingomonas sp. TaxID=158754 RepID=UPI0025F1A5E0|nr:ABC transporter substrate-binding protein [uncultured Sphingomonas sp.]